MADPTTPSEPEQPEQPEQEPQPEQELQPEQEPQPEPSEASEPQPDTVVVVEPAPRPRRRGLIAAIVVISIIVVLGVAAVIAESLARQQASALIADQVRESLQLDPEHPVEVTIDGASVLLQVIGGRLDEVTVDAPGVSVGELAGDLTLIAQGVAIDPAQPSDSVQAVYRVAEADVAAIAGFLAGTVVNDVQLDEREIRFQTAFSFFGIDFSVGLGLTPSVQDGQLAFTPSSVQLGDERLDAAQLQEQFGGLVEPLLTSQRFCVAQYLPQALELTSVQVGDEQLVVVFAAEDAALGGPEFSTRGACG
ncbi:LmeA family phospholipid-binding protein [Microcella humidisoli]|uniref:DUF2993 domain-containing protein n=1 Tax=Microcella humidisoli TaxID=2963406 RepID=A0ABY5FX74_9MICO|nr:DUF2993 domain-containing protein [Microcella humidisoli]UTT62673.1 DUF2993 domain-containing protein [Microcella humidisoli]